MGVLLNSCSSIGNASFLSGWFWDSFLVSNFPKFCDVSSHGFLRGYLLLDLWVSLTKSGGVFRRYLFKICFQFCLSSRTSVRILYHCPAGPVVSLPLPSLFPVSFSWGNLVIFPQIHRVCPLSPPLDEFQIFYCIIWFCESPLLLFVTFIFLLAAVY